MSTTPTTPETTAVDPQNPWLGLASFTEETRQYFYGREEEVAELARRVQRKLLTILFGQSGLGKTSILRAGIVPRLRPEGYCPVYVRIDYAADSPPPAEQIKQAIYRATEASGTWTQPGTAIDGESLWEFLHHRDDILRDAAGKPVIPLLIFDQFEEIFTLAQADDAGRKRAAQFIEDLADLVENRPPKVLEAKLETDDSIIDRFDFSRADYRILIALREDYLAHLEGVKSAMPSITQNRMRLARMNGQQALAAVMKPGGKLVSLEVAESIVRFVAGGSELPNAEVEPSLLSLICRELNNARVAQHRSEISADLIAGSNETILNEFYERALADQPAAVRKAIEDHLLTESGYRENLAEERVLKAFTAAGAKPDAATTLATLVNRRLLRIEERLDIRRVELTHDVLCGVVKASREQRLEREALEAAEKNLAAQKERARATKKALIRARQIAIGCGVLSVVAIASALYGFYSAQRATNAEAIAVKTQALSETSRSEAEKLVIFILDDFYDEMAPIGRLDVVGGLAKKAVEYYRQLPAEARTAETKRNSAIALARFAEVTNALGKSDDAGKLVSEANEIIKVMRTSGDDSDDTIIADARIKRVEGLVLSTRGDLEGSLRVGTETLAGVAPLLARTNVPRAARWIEAELLRGTGFALLRLERTDQAIEALKRSRMLTREFGAVALTDLAATNSYLGASWVLGEALSDVGKSAEAANVLKDSIALADKLLLLRPGHRPALRNKASMLGQLAQNARAQLQTAESLRFMREALRVQEEVRALDPGSSNSQNNLRVVSFGVAGQLFALGRMDEAASAMRIALQIPREERISGYSAVNLSVWHSVVATFEAALGNRARANVEMAAAARYAGDAKAAGAGANFLALARMLNATQRADIARMDNDGLSAARDELDQEAAAYIAVLGGNLTGRRAVAVAHVLRASATLSLAMGDYAAAEKRARSALEMVRSTDNDSLRDGAEASQSRALLAIALARQGKVAEANQVLAPALAFYQLPAVFKSDDETLKVQHARALYAAALANPVEKSKYLGEAAQRFDLMPAPLKRLKNFVIVREEIAREMAK